ncbi:SDR family NAD(P)-dependent oxidoreductase [Armatimonas rosea]|uniref:3-oxoacyl-[acyl-carrier protein] reductase n=1 Tax=Armatimonas rosea TaxID=685828 RepID=A0A7W9SQI8_ARMRO|nr:SDR family NAD(P)-dependent oxidoreductase [Armatimonas rosea]MBB6050981.1 3-oxoacyl-[acyl-carrier protein] reductase [Armatimonas rosea]
MQGKVALVTGGATGLGRELALRLAGEGVRLALAYSRSQTDAETLVAELHAQGADAHAFQADLAQTAAARVLVEETVATFGQLDLVIHNAATTRFAAFSDLEAIDEAAWDELFAVNTRAAFFLAQAAAPHLRATRGQFLSTSSVAGLAPVGSSIPYAASKAALIHLTKCLAVALAPEVRVNTVAPGLLLTRWVVGFTDEQLAATSQKALLKKTTDLVDVVDAFMMLARNSSMTGQVLTVDAGLLSG